MLYPTSDRRLSLYRNPKCAAPEADAMEDFLVSTVLADPGYVPANLELTPEEHA